MCCKENKFYTTFYAFVVAFLTFGSVRLVISCSIRRTSVGSNAIQTIDINETAYLIIYCLNYTFDATEIRHEPWALGSLRIVVYDLYMHVIE